MVSEVGVLPSGKSLSSLLSATDSPHKAPDAGGSVVNVLERALARTAFRRLESPLDMKTNESRNRARMLIGRMWKIFVPIRKRHLIV